MPLSIDIRQQISPEVKPSISPIVETAGGKRILFVLPNSGEFGGLEKHLLQLIERLVQYDVLISIVCFGPDIFSGHMNSEWSGRIRVCAKTEPATLSAWARLFRELKTDRVVFCYGWIASFPWQATLASILAGISPRFAIQHLVLPPFPPRPEGIGPRVTLRRLIGKSKRRLLGWKVGGACCTQTICVSNAVRDSLVTRLGFSPRKTITVHNGVSVSAFTPSLINGAAKRRQLGIGPDEFVLVCAARLSPVKGIDILLHAVSNAIRKGVPCKCIVIGDGPLKEELVRLAGSLGLEGSVYFEGFQMDVLPYLQAGSAFILTSHLEGLPLSVLEASSCGLPCIVTDVGGSAEAVKQNLTGLVISPGSVQEAEDAIVYLATHVRERSEMGVRAREFMRTSFDIEKQMGELVDKIVA